LVIGTVLQGPASHNRVDPKGEVPELESKLNVGISKTLITLPLCLPHIVYCGDCTFKAVYLLFLLASTAEQTVGAPTGALSHILALPTGEAAKLLNQLYAQFE
jgi:hypothetical protein